MTIVVDAAAAIIHSPNIYRHTLVTHAALTQCLNTMNCIRHIRIRRIYDLIDIDEKHPTGLMTVEQRQQMKERLQKGPESITQEGINVIERIVLSNVWQNMPTAHLYSGDQKFSQTITDIKNDPAANLWCPLASDWHEWLIIQCEFVRSVTTYKLEDRPAEANPILYNMTTVNSTPVENAPLSIQKDEQVLVLNPLMAGYIDFVRLSKITTMHELNVYLAEVINIIEKIRLESRLASTVLDTVQQIYGAVYNHLNNTHLSTMVPVPTDEMVANFFSTTFTEVRRKALTVSSRSKLSMCLTTYLEVCILLLNLCVNVLQSDMRVYTVAPNVQLLSLKFNRELGRDSTSILLELLPNEINNLAEALLSVNAKTDHHEHSMTYGLRMKEVATTFWSGRYTFNRNECQKIVQNSIGEEVMKTTFLQKLILMLQEVETQDSRQNTLSPQPGTYVDESDVLDAGQRSLEAQWRNNHKMTLIGWWGHSRHLLVPHYWCPLPMTYFQHDIQPTINRERTIDDVTFTLLLAQIRGEKLAFNYFSDYPDVETNLTRSVISSKRRLEEDLVIDHTTGDIIIQVYAYGSLDDTWSETCDDDAIENRRLWFSACVAGILPYCDSRCKLAVNPSIRYITNRLNIIHVSTVEHAVFCDSEVEDIYLNRDLSILQHIVPTPLDTFPFFTQPPNKDKSITPASEDNPGNVLKCVQAVNKPLQMALPSGKTLDVINDLFVSRTLEYPTMTLKTSAAYRFGKDNYYFLLGVNHEALNAVTHADPSTELCNFVKLVTINFQKQTMMEFIFGPKLLGGPGTALIRSTRKSQANRDAGGDDDETTTTVTKHKMKKQIVTSAGQVLLNRVVGKTLLTPVATNMTRKTTDYVQQLKKIAQQS